ncbi:putative glutamine amidotransferase [Pseudochelatococcus lubricantis]|uniref:Glutamine amidotransferase n=1 Tax=Pseudochelatococcus lubricantis TaxID=1538102 RepID=A0ABX0UY05_9HYPH|nr:gamma-glutamyl-gamma-aminobutyrate hydrolase family protein [Pseudochelatococcus lubricantis]NIJ56754.1 putative glutamine amidotransferase [Pseudochelatococcus lubricantis]
MRPVIGVVADVKPSRKYVWHKVQEKYLYAVARGADAEVVILPGRLSAVDAEERAISPDPDRLLAFLDGVFLPGSPSNVDPAIYGDERTFADELLDRNRDDLSLPLVRAAVERGLPLFGVCRGFQEINAALGGTLHQHVQDIDGFGDHREPDGDVETQYGLAHEVELVEGGVLHGLAGAGRVSVNSLHSQGIDRLAPGLVAEAYAPDGLIEAFHVAAAREQGAFAIAVQWHPEWRVWADPLSTALFRAFGDAARGYAAARSR